MLVFTRKVGETIVINGDIEVTIIRVGPNDVRLGIVAPDEVPVVRNELDPTDAKEINVGEWPRDDEGRLIIRLTK